MLMPLGKSEKKGGGGGGGSGVCENTLSVPLGISILLKTI